MLWLKQNRFLLLRRVCQLGIIFLFLMGEYASWSILKGNLSGSLLFNTIPLSDPFGILQLLFSGAIFSATFVISQGFLGALIVVLFYGVFAGRAYCAFVCPMNLVTDFAYFLRTKLGITKNIQLKRNLRYVILALSLILSILLGLAAFEFISPVSTLHRGLVFGIGMGSFLVLCVFLFDLFVLKHGFCGYLCPVGALYSLIGRFSLLKVKYDLPSCTHCHACLRVCPEVQVLDKIGKESGSISGGECMRCGKCIEVCGDNALNFSLIDLRRGK